MTTRRRASPRPLIFVAADKVGMNFLRLLDLGLLVLGLLGLLSLLLCGLLDGVVVVGAFLLTNRTVHRVDRGTCWVENPSSDLELL